MDPTPSVPSDSLAGVHVLVVDDNPAARELLRTILEYAGALVTLAESAERALRIMDYAVPHVLISDISMPGHDGWWLIEQVRSRQVVQGGRVPAIALTALADDDAGTIGAGFQAYLRKPVDPWELCRLVGSLVPPGA
jgi:CheY-like chemotaxis protein